MEKNPLWLHLIGHFWDVRNELAKIRIYSDRLESFFSNEAQKMDTEFDEATQDYKTIEGDLRHGIVEKYTWELTSNHFDFPGMLRISTVLSLYNLLEHQLNSICRSIEFYNDSNVRLVDIKGNGIERARLFLTRIAKIDFSHLNTEWTFINSIKLLRNNIVHSGAMLPVDHKHGLCVFVQNNKFLDIEVDGKLIIKQGFIEQIIDTFLSFFEKFLKYTKNSVG